MTGASPWNFEGGAFHLILPNHSSRPPTPVIPTGASRRFFFSFAPAKLSARAAEESLFDRSRKPRCFFCVPHLSCRPAIPFDTISTAGLQFYSCQPIYIVSLKY